MSYLVLFRTGEESLTEFLSPDHLRGGASSWYTPSCVNKLNEREADLGPENESEADLGPENEADLGSENESEADLRSENESEADLGPENESEADLGPENESEADLGPECLLIRQTSLPPRPRLQRQAVYAAISVEHIKISTFLYTN